MIIEMNDARYATYRISSLVPMHRCVECTKYTESGDKAYCTILVPKKNNEPHSCILYQRKKQAV